MNESRSFYASIMSHKTNSETCLQTHSVQVCFTAMKQYDPWAFAATVCRGKHADYDTNSRAVMQLWVRSRLVDWKHALLQSHVHKIHAENLILFFPLHWNPIIIWIQTNCLPVKAACVCLFNKKRAESKSTNNELHYFIYQFREEGSFRVPSRCFPTGSSNWRRWWLHKRWAEDKKLTALVGFSSKICSCCKILGFELMPAQVNERFTDIVQWQSEQFISTIPHHNKLW